MSIWTGKAASEERAVLLLSGEFENNEVSSYITCDWKFQSGIYAVQSLVQNNVREGTLCLDSHTTALNLTSTSVEKRTDEKQVNARFIRFNSAEGTAFLGSVAAP